MDTSPKQHDEDIVEKVLVEILQDHVEPIWSDDDDVSDVSSCGNDTDTEKNPFSAALKAIEQNLRTVSLVADSHRERDVSYMAMPNMTYTDAASVENIRAINDANEACNDETAYNQDTEQNPCASTFVCHSSPCTTHDQFAKEIHRAIYSSNVNDPPSGTAKYFEAAQNYALFGLIDQYQSTGFDAFIAPAACTNETFYPNQITTQTPNLSNCGIEGERAGVITMPPTVFVTQSPQSQQAIIPGSNTQTNIPINNRLHLRALHNFCQQAAVVNSTLSAAYKQHLNQVMNCNTHQQALVRSPPGLPLPWAYGNALAERYLASQKAAAVAQILQQNRSPTRAITSGTPNITRPVLGRSFFAATYPQMRMGSFPQSMQNQNMRFNE